LVVAHFDHGIRPDSKKDGEFVAAYVHKLRLPFEIGYGELGAGASEEVARKARYQFLEKVRAQHSADAIITAHHQDDLIETALLNSLRGTGRRGLTAISSNKRIIRPLLGYSKAQVLDYAEKHGVKWHEDETNSSDDYLRNYIRHNLVPKMSVSQRQELLATLGKASSDNREMDEHLSNISSLIKDKDAIDRQAFAALPSEVGNELLVYWLRQEGIANFDKQTIGRLNVALRTAKARTNHPVKKGSSLSVGQKTARFEHRSLR
jgi:tRNA(Ile)-lysidine synthase